MAEWLEVGRDLLPFRFLIRLAEEWSIRRHSFLLLWMSFGFRCVVFSDDCFLLTHVCAPLCGPVAFGPCEVIDFRRQIYPHNRVRRASSLCGCFSCELPSL